jgi:hypothetical protein
MIKYQVMPRREPGYYQAKLVEAKRDFKNNKCPHDGKLLAEKCPVCSRAYMQVVEELKELA